MDLTSLITSFSYIAICVLMIANGVINIPSSQLLYLICGYLVSTGTLSFTPTIVAGAIGNTVGNMITYMLVKKYGKPFANKLLMVDTTTFNKVHDALMITFSKKGIWYIFIGKITPSIKAFIPVLAGLSSTPSKLTVFIFLIASTIWAVLITSLGYFFGNQVSLGSFALISFIVGLTILYYVYTNVSKNFAK